MSLIRVKRSVPDERMMVAYSICLARRLPSGLAAIRAALKEPAEYALLDELQRRWPKIEQALQHEQFLDAMNQLAHLQAPVDRFFVDVLVMAEDQTLREARLALLATLRDTVLQTGGDISEIAPEETKQSDK